MMALQALCRLLILALTLGLGAPALAANAEDLFRQGHYKEAVAAFQKAAGRGDMLASFRLGEIYIDGVVVGRDYAKAAKYLKAPALAGHAEAQSEYAMLLDNGWGVTRSRADAAKFYLKAAERGVPAAMFNIGAMLETGEGIKSDVVQAFKWYRLAYERGMDPIVSEPLNQLAERMSADEIRAGLVLVESYKPVKGLE
jgi:TPR repeat protein